MSVGDYTTNYRHYNYGFRVIVECEAFKRLQAEQKKDRDRKKR